MGSGASVRRRSACLRTGKAIQSLGLRLLQFRLPVFSRLHFGRIYGGTTDQNAGVLDGAKVTVVDVQRGVSRYSIVPDSTLLEASRLVSTRCARKPPIAVRIMDWTSML